MKTQLELVQSSFLFFGKLNLTRNKPLDVDVDQLDTDTLSLLKTYIQSGMIKSSEDLTHVVIAPKIVEQKVEIVEETVVEVTEEVEQPKQEAEEQVEQQEDAEVKPEPKKATKGKK